MFSEHRATNYGLSYPNSGGSAARLAYLGFDFPLTLSSFLFVPSVRLIVPLGVANLTTEFPRLLPILRFDSAGMISSEVGVNGLCPART